VSRHEQSALACIAAFAAGQLAAIAAVAVILLLGGFNDHQDAIDNQRAEQSATIEQLTAQACEMTSCEKLP
jgi:hypothetical protein